MFWREGKKLEVLCNNSDYTKETWNTELFFIANSESKIYLFLNKVQSGHEISKENNSVNIFLFTF